MKNSSGNYASDIYVWPHQYYCQKNKKNGRYSNNFFVSGVYS